MYVPDLCAYSPCVLTNRLCPPGVCLCHQPQLPPRFKLKHKHLKHFSCLVLVQFMQLKTGPTHDPQSWCCPNSVILLDISRLRKNWSSARTDSEHPSIQCNYFHFHWCFISLNEACMHICQQVSTRWTQHQIDTWRRACSVHSLILCKDLNSGKGLVM